MAQINSGILNTLDFSFFAGIEQKIVTNLSKIWSIGFCKKEFFHNSDYPIVFLKPTNRLTEQFHFTREILAVFSGFEDFQPKTFDLIDKILNDHNSRLDKLCFVIISRDPKIDQKIKDIILQDNEARIIISFHYNELLEDFEHIEEKQYSKLRTSFYTRDLFAYETPLKHEAYFFGRQDIVQSLYGKYHTGQWGALFGLRRIGKTSVLYTLKRLLATRGEPSVYIDCSDTSFYFNRWNIILHKILISIATSNNLTPTKLVSDISKYENTTNAAETFEKDLEKIYRALGKKRILIILDEIENITFNLSSQTHWREENDALYFWQNLRSLFQRKTEIFSCIIAGVNPHSIELANINTYDNPIYRYITPIYLPFFSTQEIKEMVSTIGSYMGVSFDDEIFTYFIDDFGGHPFIVRQICSKIIKESYPPGRPLHITKYQYLEKNPSFKKSITDYMEQIISILKNRYKDEYDLLIYLAQGDVKSFKEIVDLYPAMLEHLKGYGLIKEDVGNYYFSMKSIQGHLLEKEKLDKKPTKIEEKWAQISEKRNSFESNLRKIVRDVLKHKHGISKAKNLFIDIISEQKIKKRFEEMSYNAIFEDHLYFEDLRKVIEKNYTDFQHIFPTGDKDKFKTYMTNVNKYRIDAHANDIDEDDFTILTINLKWLNEKIIPYLD